MNKAILQGKVHKIFTGEHTTIVTMLIKDDSKKEVMFYYPQIFFYGKLRDEIKKYAKDDYVQILAEMVSKQKKDDNGKTYYDQYLRGYSIAFTVNEMSKNFNTKLRGPFDYKNEVYIEGTFISCSEKNNSIGIIVKPDGDDFNLYMISNVSKDMIKGLSKGSHIFIRGKYITKKVVNGENSRFTKYLIVKQIEQPQAPATFDLDDEKIMEYLRKKFL